MSDLGYEEVQKASTSKRLKFLFKDSILYGGVSSASKFLHLFLLPVLTRLVSKEDYGVYDTLLIISNLILILIIAGTDSSVARFFYDTKDKVKQKELISQTLFFQIGVSLIVCTMIWYAAEPILYFYFNSNFYLMELKILIGTLPFIALVRFSQNVLKWLFKRKEFLIISAGSIISTVFLSILAVTQISADIKYLFLSQLTAMIIFAALGLFYCRDFIHLTTSLDTIVDQLKFGLPFSFNRLLTALIPAMDRYFITSFLGLSSLGIYAVGNKISQLSQIGINGFQIAWGPLAYSVIEEKNRNDTYRKVFNYYILFVSLFIIIFAFATPLLISILATKEYSSAVFIILILLISKLISSISGITAIGIEVSKKTYLHVFNSIVHFASTTLLIYTFIPFGAITGVATGVLIGNIIFVIISNYFAYRVSNVRFKFTHPIIILFISFLSGIVILYFNLFIIKFLIMMISSIIVIIHFYFFIYDNKEKKFILKYIDKLNKKNY